MKATVFAFFVSAILASPGRAQDAVKLPKYLRVWNETLTHRQALATLVPQGSLRLQQWYSGHPSLNTPHQIAVDFLDQDQFFIRSPRRLILYNMSNLRDGILLISRRPFAVRESETLATLERRLERMTHGQPTKSLFGQWGPSSFNSLLQALYSLLCTPAAAEKNAMLDWAPVVTLLDIFWTKTQAPARPHRQDPASNPTVTSPPAIKKQTHGVK